MNQCDGCEYNNESCIVSIIEMRDMILYKTDCVYKKTKEHIDDSWNDKNVCVWWLI